MKATIVSSWDVVQHVRNIHYAQSDFVEGNIRERIEEYGMYQLVEIPVSKLEEPCDYIDEELIAEYQEMPLETVPAIVVGFYSDGDYQTIDGGHRITVAKAQGRETVMAYVGDISTFNAIEHEEEVDE